MTVTIAIDESRCGLCGKCADVCLARLFELTGEKIHIAENLDPCIRCGHCMCVCPDGAISVGEDKVFPLPDGEKFTPEEVLALIRRRRSTRNYKQEPVSRDLIEKVIEGGRFAPTGGNSQSIRFTVVTDSAAIETLKGKVINVIRGFAEGLKANVNGIDEKYQNKGAITHDDEALRKVSASFLRKTALYDQGQDTVFYGAPVVMVLHGSQTIQANQYNANVMAMCMTLMAESLGLGTCLMGVLPAAYMVDGKAIGSLLQLPEEDCIYMGMVLGHPSVAFLNIPDRRPAEINWV